MSKNRRITKPRDNFILFLFAEQRFGLTLDKKQETAVIERGTEKEATDVCPEEK